eukprot:TRINITY_DN8489_c0_g1_i1.p1 TRINITY_DN8489_c0_g1~~TRINITY_DN8489_c0_g1_i1.p1  ORF type:complete len:459 (+),score=82.39 TRINITY_DN8489_c0_g1_i1:125-1501(+)
MIRENEKVSNDLAKLGNSPLTHHLTNLSISMKTMAKQMDQALNALLVQGVDITKKMEEIQAMRTAEFGRHISDRLKLLQEYDLIRDERVADIKSKLMELESVLSSSSGSNNPEFCQNTLNMVVEIRKKLNLLAEIFSKQIKDNEALGFGKTKYMEDQLVSKTNEIDSLHSQLEKLMQVCGEYRNSLEAKRTEISELNSIMEKKLQKQQEDLNSQFLDDRVKLEEQISYLTLNLQQANQTIETLENKCLSTLNAVETRQNSLKGDGISKDVESFEEQKDDFSARLTHAYSESTKEVEKRRLALRDPHLIVDAINDLLEQVDMFQGLPSPSAELVKDYMKKSLMWIKEKGLEARNDTGNDAGKVFDPLGRANGKPFKLRAGTPSNKERVMVHSSKGEISTVRYINGKTTEDGKDLFALDKTNILSDVEIIPESNSNDDWVNILYCQASVLEDLILTARQD